MKLFAIALFCIAAAVVVVRCAPNTPQNKFWNVNFNPSGEDPTKYFGSFKSVSDALEESGPAASENEHDQLRFKMSQNESGKAYSYYPSPEDWRSESVYQLLTDRFNDGQPENNEGPYYYFNGYDPRFVNTRHGGDFKGLKDRLYYIKALGYTAIWISPVFQNMENSYHGYAQIDFTILDDRFGTLDEFRDMVKAAHDLGLRVIVDIVVNHMADLYYFDGFRGQETPFRMHLNEYKLYPHRPQRQYVDFKVNNDWHYNLHYGNVYDDQGNVVVDESPYYGSFWSSDFHHNGDLRDAGYGQPWNNHLGKIYGLMDDLRTTHPRVVQKIIAMTRSLITSTDIDGVRVDTPMQVPLSFFQDWVPAIKSHAKSLGKNNFGVWGEFYCTRERASTMTGRGLTKIGTSKHFIGDDAHVTMDGGIHYPLYWWFLNTVKDQKHDLDGIMRLYQQDSQDYDFYNPSNSWKWEYRHWHFFNNHDQWRIAASTSDGKEKTLLASGIIAFWPGIPLYYYGDEQGFNSQGTALDGWAREDFMTSLAWGNSCDQKQMNPSQVDNFDMANPSFLHVQKLMAVRRQYVNLQKCDLVYERWHQAMDTNGVYAYTRACGSDEKTFALVIFNTWSMPLSIPKYAMYSGWKKEKEVVNVMSDINPEKGIPFESYSLNDDGFFHNDIIVGPYEVKVLFPLGGWKTTEPRVVEVHPKHDSIVKFAGNYIMKIRFDQPMNTKSVLSNIKIDGLFLQDIAESVSVEDHDRVFSFVVSNAELFADGIHKIVIDHKSIQSSAGIKMFASFMSRFRVGALENNVIMNPCLNYKTQDTAVSSVVDSDAPQSVRTANNPLLLKCTYTNKIRNQWDMSYFSVKSASRVNVTIKNFASGASKVRVRLGHTKSPFENQSKEFLEMYNPLAKLPKSNQTLEDKDITRKPLDMKMMESDSFMDNPGDCFSCFYADERSIKLNQWFGPWSKWVDYDEQTKLSVWAEWLIDRLDIDCDKFRIDASELSNQNIPITIQYYADGSSSYMINSHISKFNS